MIIGGHTIINSTDAEADLAFFRDVLKLTNVDVGGGWLIFGLPPAELAVHPSGKNDVHEFYLMCDDVEAFVALMKEHGIHCDPVQDQGYGLVTQLTLPGGGKLGVYQPSHARPAPMGEEQTVNISYRSGGVGAMMDEYERAAADLKQLIAQTSEDAFTRIVDTQTNDDSCRSIQTIITHVIRAGYGYANYIRESFSIDSAQPASELVVHRDAVHELEEMLSYTSQTLDGRWEMSDEEIEQITIHSHWGMTYNLEQLLEHAIVHILRHRRQIERFKTR